jgi:hypothetical protein
VNSMDFCWKWACCRVVLFLGLVEDFKHCLVQFHHLSYVDWLTGLLKRLAQRRGWDV